MSPPQLEARVKSTLEQRRCGRHKCEPPAILLPSEEPGDPENMTATLKEYAHKPSGQLARRFSCFTLNVLASPVPANQMEEERLAWLAQHIDEKDYDVVAFQEFIPGPSYRWQHARRYQRFVEKLRGMGFLYDICGPEPRSLFVLDGGIAIFSKHPFVRSSVHHFQEQASWDSWAAKGILHAMIEVQPPCEHIDTTLQPTVGASVLHPVYLHVFTLHAQASHHGWQDTAGAAKYREVRLRQMRQLADVIRIQAADGEPVLALGDFNFDAGNSVELADHQAELANAGRSRPPVDVVEASFGYHPGTFAWKNPEGKLAEPFLTTTEALLEEQCLDHVYYWPPEFEPASGRTATISDVSCTWEDCPITNPCHSKGDSPAHVSDHCGWSVDISLQWAKTPENASVSRSLATASAGSTIIESDCDSIGTNSS